MVLNDKGFFLDRVRVNDVIYESINEIYNERNGEHYLILSEISGGEMKRVDINDLMNDYIALTPALLMGEGELLEYYTKMLINVVEFEMLSTKKTNDVRDKLDKKYKLSKKVGFDKK